MRRPKCITWFVIADGARFRVFESARPAKDFNLILNEESEQARRPSRKFDVNRPGCGRGIGTGASYSLEPTQDFYEAAKRGFLRGAMEFVNTGAREGRSQHLAIIAPPKALAAISQDALDKTIASLSLDLTKTPVHELRDRLEEKIHHW